MVRIRNGRATRGSLTLVALVVLSSPAWAPPVTLVDTAAEYEQMLHEYKVPITPDMRRILEEMRTTPRMSKRGLQLLIQVLDVVVPPLKVKMDEERKKERERERLRLISELEERRSEAKRKADKLRKELDRLERLNAYCENGDLYFRKTLMGFGSWIEEDASTGEAIPIEEFDLNNAVLNRLMELQAAGWKNKIPAKTVACGPGVQAIYDVLR